MNTKQLKQKILNLAIRGKLVPQDENDEPAKYLLQRVIAEKENQANRAKSKPINKDVYAIKRLEKYNDLPTGWVLTSLGGLFNLQAGKFVPASNISENDTQNKYPCYGGNGLRGYVECSNRNGDYPLIGRQGALCGNLNYASGQFYATEHAVVVETFAETNPRWAYWFLKELNLNQYATATAQPGLSVNKINEVQIPLPPLAEQRRIVAAIDSAFAVIDEIERNKTDLQAAVTAAKQKILSLAIQGKLVPQDPNDEPAEYLLQRVITEKENYVNKAKSKPIKKYVNAINERHEKYNDLPTGWVLTSLGELFNLQAGKFIPASNIAENDTKNKYPCYGGNGLRGYVESSNRNGEYPLIGRQGALCGNLNYAAGQFYATEHAVVVETFAETNPRWAFWFLKELNLNQYATATAQPGLSVNKINEVFIPLPPLSEQHRIVQSIESAFMELDAILQYSKI
jgi:type I restriction enzyme S subunit